ncbi:MAG: hypothetical protein Q7U96_06460 [Chloroflexota bacterium]|nr:hypothetical protein [Chloroflexota bacterium]
MGFLFGKGGKVFPRDEKVGLYATIVSAVIVWLCVAAVAVGVSDSRRGGPALAGASTD